jgi:hypothetical protein
MSTKSSLVMKELFNGPPSDQQRCSVAVSSVSAQLTSNDPPGSTELVIYPERCTSAIRRLLDLDKVKELSCNDENRASADQLTSDRLAAGKDLPLFRNEPSTQVDTTNDIESHPIQYWYRGRYAQRSAVIRNIAIVIGQGDGGDDSLRMKYHRCLAK